MPSFPLVRTLPRVYVLGATLLCILFLPRAHAQVNTETMRVEDELSGFSGELGGTLQARGGNKSLNVLGTASRIEFRKNRHAAFVEGKLQLVENDGQVIFNTGFGHLRYTLKSSFATWFSYEAFGQLDVDKGRFLDQRRLAGAGVRIRIIKQDSMLWYLGIHPMVEYEDLDDSRVDSEPELSTVARLSSFLRFEWRFRGRMSLSNVAYVQPRFDRLHDVRLLDQAIFRVAITRRLVFTTTFGIRYDSDPPDELDSVDYTIQNGIAFGF